MSGSTIFIDPFSNIEHSPILIKFINPVLMMGQDLESTDPIPGTRTRIEVTAPSPNSPGYSQFYPASVTNLAVPTDGILRFKLYPTSMTIPMGRYKIKYFESNNSLPAHEEEWIVPRIHQVDTYTMTHNASADGDVFPDLDSKGYAIFSLKRVNHVGEYRIYKNKIQWLNNPPEDGQQYTISYVPALTLQHIKSDAQQELHRGWLI